MKLILTFDECQSELKCTHCLYLCLLNESQESVACVYLYFMHMISQNMNKFLIVPSGIRVIWDPWERWAFQDLMD